MLFAWNELIQQESKGTVRSRFELSAPCECGGMWALSPSLLSVLWQWAGLTCYSGAWYVGCSSHLVSKPTTDHVALVTYQRVV